MKRLSEQKRRAGFTLAEILVTVAILTILLALAVPNVLAYYRRLKLAELDDSARAIFMAAQNRMTAMINAGEMEKLTPDGTTGIGSSLTVSFLEKGSTGELLPAGSIESDLADGDYIIEYFPESGAVYAVFFTDDKVGMTDYRGSYVTLQSRGRADRLEKKPLVGYFGDSEERQIDRVEVGQMPVPQVTLTNAEELMLDIVLPAIQNPPTGFDATNINLKVTISNATSDPKTIVEGCPGNVDTRIHLALDTLKSYPASPGSMTSTALTDGLTAGAHFKDWVGSSGIQPGDDIKVTVTVSYANGDSSVQFLPQTVVVTGNSLFASVDGTTAKIAYGRHLQNLDSGVSGVKQEITQAEQVREIDFGKTGGGIESWVATYGGLGFAPIENERLTSYEGRSLPIRKLNAQNSSGSAGLFGDIKNASLKNIVLIDAQAAGTTVGTLAGTAQGVTVENCQVYLESLDKRTESPAALLNGSTVGGLIGSAAGCDISYSFASTVEKGSGTVGGLLGTVSGGAVKNCYAAGYLDGDRVGGLLGDASDGTAASECYAAGIIVGCSSAAAGLCPSDISITNGYAAVRYATNRPMLRKIIGTTTSSSERIPYVRQPGITYQGYGRPVTTSALMKEEVAGDCWLYARTADAAGMSQNPISAVFPYWQTKESSMLQPPYPYPMLKGKDGTVMFHFGDWLAAESVGFLAYYEKYADDNFGLHTNYAAVQNTASASFINSLTNDPAKPVVEDGYAVVTEGEQSQPSVKIGTTEYDLTSSKIGSVEIDGKDYWLFALPEEVLKAPDGTAAITSYYTKLTIGGNDGEPYYFNPHFACEAFDGKTLVSPTEEQLKTPQPKKGVVLGTSVPGITDPVTNEKDVLIRTARQLADLAAYTAVPPIGAGVVGTAVCENALTWSYHQLLDIDYATYTGPDTEPDTEPDLSFSTGKELTPQYPAQLAGGSYDGHEHEIRNLYLTSGADNNAGLFGTVSAAADPANPANPAVGGTLKNIRMTNITVTNNAAAGGAATGSLAGSVTGGTLQNIRLSNVTVTDSMSSGGTGGMTGEVTGGSTLENVRLINVAVTGSGAATGGMAGAVNGGSVTDCGIYAEETDGVTSAVNYDTHPIDYTGSDKNACIGGLIGSAVDAAISRSFAAVKVSGGTVGGFVGALSGGTVTDCYSGGHTVGGIYDGKDGNVVGRIADGKVGGFAGSIGGTTFGGVCYSTCSVQAGWNIRKFRMFSGEGDANGGTLYTLGGAFIEDGTKRYTESESNVRNSNVPRGVGITAFPYDNMLSGKKYPYQSGLTEHYGDWPSGSATVGCFYWEKETENGEGVYHFRLLEWESEDGSEWHAIGGSSDDKRATLIDTLCRKFDGNPITEYGYGYFTVVSDESRLSIGVDGGFTEDTNLENALIQCLNQSGTGQNFTGVKSFKIGKINNPVGYKDWSVQYGGNTYVTVNLQLDFGAMMATSVGAVNVNGSTPAIVVPDNIGDYGTKYPLQVRTISQLEHIRTSELHKAYAQGHDLNGYQSDSNTMQTILPVVTGELIGTYNGNYYRILDLNIESDGNNAALFAGVTGSGSVKNVIMYSTHGATIKERTSGKACVAGIAGDLYSGATIENCIVAGYTMQAEYKSGSTEIKDWCIGGIAGWMGMGSSIDNCEAVVTLKNKRESGGELYVSSDNGKTHAVCMGGIVGHINNGNNDRIKNCYAGGTIQDDSNAKAALIRAGGIVGLRMGGSTLELTNCYSYMRWNGVMGTGTTVFPIINTDNPYPSENTVDLVNKKICYLKDSINSMGTQDDVDAIEDLAQLDQWFKEQVDSGNQLIFHHASFINGNQVPDPAPADKDFNGAVVSVPINGAGNVQYVHYGELPKDP